MSEWISGTMNPWKTAALYPSRYYLYFADAYDLKTKVLYKITNKRDIEGRPYTVHSQRCSYVISLIERTDDVSEWDLRTVDYVNEHGWYIYLMEVEG